MVHSLSDHERLLKVVVAVVNEAKKGTQVAVVVSAMGKTTDVLMTTAKDTSNSKLEKHDLDDILSMGERTSIRIFAAALKTNGAESCYFDPNRQQLANNNRFSIPKCESNPERLRKKYP